MDARLALQMEASSMLEEWDGCFSAKMVSKKEYLAIRARVCDVGEVRAIFLI